MTVTFYLVSGAEDCGYTEQQDCSSARHVLRQKDPDRAASALDSTLQVWQRKAGRAGRAVRERGAAGAAAALGAVLRAGPLWRARSALPGLRRGGLLCSTVITDCKQRCRRHRAVELYICIA